MTAGWVPVRCAEVGDGRVRGISEAAERVSVAFSREQRDLFWVFAGGQGNLESRVFSSLTNVDDASLSCSKVPFNYLLAFGHGLEMFLRCCLFEKLCIAAFICSQPCAPLALSA